MEDHIVKSFGNRLRIRACGFLVNDSRVLLVKHHEIGEEGILWSPPGGGVEYGASVKDNLKREFLEETGLVINVKEFVGVSEFLSLPLHAVELFFLVDLIEGSLVAGFDPELSEEEQIIKEVRFVTFKELLLIPNNQKHRFLHDVGNASDLMKNRQFIDEN